MSETALGKYMRVEQWPDEPGRKTKRWRVYSASSDADLGTVGWFGRWRQYCFDPCPNTTFNKGCLDDLSGFLDKVNADHRRVLKIAKAIAQAEKEGLYDQAEHLSGSKVG